MIDLHTRAETIKLLEQNKGLNLCDLQNKEPTQLNLLKIYKNQDNMVLEKEQIDQWHRTEKPEIDLQTHSQMIFEED